MYELRINSATTDVKDTMVIDNAFKTIIEQDPVANTFVRWDAKIGLSDWL